MQKVFFSTTSAAAAVVMTAMLTVCSCGKATGNEREKAASSCSPAATWKQAGEKATYYRFEKLRSGAIKTEKGCTIQDFAPFYFNPNSVPITVTMTMVSDDPNFVFTNGRIGTYTKTLVLQSLKCIDS